MKTELQSLSKIFTEKLFRIPDYQRGYAWTGKQLKEFWDDLMQLEAEHNHYVGVLTLEDVPPTTYNKWEEDLWIINSKSFLPYYVVDGQQRLTTSIILIESITEIIGEEETINYSSRDEIRKKFIFETKDKGISRSYIFGYEKDNPSYEYLKTRIFNEVSDSSETPQETIYTHNLEIAKNFFISELKKLDKPGLETVFKKITQNFLFNIYAISEDVDTYVAFETMNNRGKPLSHLELLKNRLIYLSTKFEDTEEEKNKLRVSINEAWKSVYHFLGKNKENPLDDDAFLINHFILYFGKKYNDQLKVKQVRRRWGPEYQLNYQDYLLDIYFSSKTLLKTKNSGTESHLNVSNVYSYVKSLKNSVETWYYILNPKESIFPQETIAWLEKLNRISVEPVAPLVMVFVQKCSSKKKLLNFIKIIEQYLFVLSLFSFRYFYENKPLILVDLASDLGAGTTSCDSVTNIILERLDGLKKDPMLARRIRDEFKDNGFYKWEAIRYFLYEYELHLKEGSKTSRDKLSWDTLTKDLRDHYTVEHIYPQNCRKKHWTSKFGIFNTNERNALRNSLGNLLPLSKPKNSSLQDKSFDEKKGKQGSKVGFAYGSYSEIDVSRLNDWTAKEILERGMTLLDFMEQRWQLNLGTRKEKVEMLGLKTVEEKLLANDKRRN